MDLAGGCRPPLGTAAATLKDSAAILDLASQLRHAGMVRLLLINQVFPPDPQATGQYLGRVAEDLARQGHDVTVLASCHDYDDPRKVYPARETWRGVTILRIGGPAFGHATKFRRIADYLAFLMGVVFRALLLPRFDVVLTLTTPPLLSVLGGILAQWWKARFVYWVMDLNPDEAIAVGWLKAGGRVARLLERCSRWSLHQANQIIVLDRYMRDRIVGKGVPENKIVIQPPWIQEAIQFDRSGRDAFRVRHDLKTALVVMYAGNHSPCHPLETLFAAAIGLKGHPRIRFCFVGGGTEWRTLRARAQVEHLENTLFLAYQPQSELAGLLSAADLQVVVMGDPFAGIIHPSKVYHFLPARRPFIYIGPVRSHVTDLIEEAGLQNQSASFRHGEVQALVNELTRRAEQDENSDWPGNLDLQKWSEKVGVEKITSALLGAER